MGPVREPHPDEVAAAILADLEGLGPVRLCALLDGTGPHALLEALIAGGRRARVEPAEALAWRDALAAVDRTVVRRRLSEGPYRVVWRGGPLYPCRLLEDPEPPAVLFVAGDVPGEGPRVAIVGTRRCTRYGIDVARELGRALAGSGVAVVSGLARGIDAAAHAGSLDVGGAAPVAIVGSGLDVVYPRANRELWRRVGEAGTLLSEAPLGAAPSRWRFPARNRLIAGLADAVVVVESRERGGSMSTVDAALTRGRPVLAVPGPVRSPASAGTNRLIADGAAPLCDVDDVLIAIGREPTGGDEIAARSGPSDAREAAVLDAVGWTPVTIDSVARHTGLAIGDAAVLVERLVTRGLLVRSGHWIEQVASR